MGAVARDQGFFRVPKSAAGPLSLSPGRFGACGGPHGRAPGVFISPLLESIRLVVFRFLSSGRRTRRTLERAEDTHTPKEPERPRLKFCSRFDSGRRGTGSVRATSEGPLPPGGPGQWMNGRSRAGETPASCLPLPFLCLNSLNSGLPRLPKLWPGLMTTVVVKTVAVSTASHRMSMHRISTWQKLGAHDGRQSRNWRQGART